MGRRDGYIEEYRARGKRLYRIRYEAAPAYDPETGKTKRRQVRESGFGSAAEARNRLRDIYGDRRDERHDQTRGRDPLAKYLTDWLAGLSVRATTMDNYRTAVEVHVMPRLGGVRLVDLSAEHLDGLYRELERHGKRSDECRTAGVTCREHRCTPERHEGLAPKSVRHVHTAVRKALQDAMQRGYVTRNVADLANPPTAKAARSRNAKTKAWTHEQLATFLALVADHRLYPLWALLATTGMRRAEVLGLRWEDVDLDAARIRVHQTITEVRGRMVVQDEAKTDAGERSFSIDRRTVETLRQWKTAQRKEWLALGIRPDHDRVFTMMDGEGYRPKRVSSLFSELVAKADLPSVGVHGLRHTYATLALRAGVSPEVVSKRLGHASVVITLSIYAHVFEQDDQAAAELVAGAIYG